jgi:hypothetical protein
MENTKIKFSSNLLNKSLIKKITLKIGETLNKSFDINKYEVFYNGVFENGVKLLFFETLNTKEFLIIYKILKNNIQNFGCFYLENKFYKGCSNGLLFNNSCSVGLIIKEKPLIVLN